MGDIILSVIFNYLQPENEMLTRTYIDALNFYKDRPYMCGIIPLPGTNFKALTQRAMYTFLKTTIPPEIKLLGQMLHDPQGEFFIRKNIGYARTFDQLVKLVLHDIRSYRSSEEHGSDSCSDQLPPFVQQGGPTNTDIKILQGISGTPLPWPLYQTETPMNGTISSFESPVAAMSGIQLDANDLLEKPKTSAPGPSFYYANGY